jgi:membrane protease YdiL (CAAX protease family)
MRGESPDGGPVPRTTLLALAIGMEGGLVLAAMGLGRLAGIDPLATLAGGPADAVRGAAAALPLLIVFGMARRSRWRPLVALREQVDGMVRTIFAECRFGDLVLIALLAGVGEEVFFRGLVQPYLGRRFGPWAGLAQASFLFGLAHPHGVAYVVLATAMGGVFGGLWMSTGSLVGPIVAHAAYDLVALAWLTRSLREDARPGGRGGISGPPAGP